MTQQENLLNITHIPSISTSCVPFSMFILCKFSIFVHLCPTYVISAQKSLLEHDWFMRKILLVNNYCLMVLDYKTAGCLVDKNASIFTFIFSVKVKHVCSIQLQINTENGFMDEKFKSFIFYCKSLLLDSLYITDHYILTTWRCFLLPWILSPTM